MNNDYKYVLTEEEQKLVDYYHNCTTCHAYDEGGRLFGKMIIEVVYNGFSK